MWRGRAEPATPFNFRLSTDLARVGQSGSGLPHGRWEGCEGMEADVGDRFDCFSGLGWKGCKCIDVCVYEIMKNLLCLLAD